MKESSKDRVILALFRLNRCIPCLSFMMTSSPQVHRALFKGACISSFDLKDAFWYVPIKRSFQKFLAFSLKQGSFCFQAMPFGLSIAPRTFTKLGTVLVRQLRNVGIILFAYLDDWLIIAKSKSQAIIHIQKVLKKFKKGRFLINLKSYFSYHPKRLLGWDGYGVLKEPQSSTL